MRIFSLILWNLILISAVCAGQITQQDIPTFTDQDLEKYKKASDPNLSPQHLEHNKNEDIGIDSSETNGTRGGTATASKDEISESEKKSLEREFNTIMASVMSRLKTGDVEGALAFFVESRKDKHRQIFTALKDNKTLKLAVEGFGAVEISWVHEHLAECAIDKNEDGKIYSYPVNFMEVAKGVWKIYNF